MCGSSHIGHHFSDDTEHTYSSDNEVIYEEIDNKIVRFPEKEDLMVKLVPQNIYVNNNNNPGISGMANGTANDQKRRHSLPNDIYTTAGPSTHNPHYQEVWLIIRDLVRILDVPDIGIVLQEENPNEQEDERDFDKDTKKINEQNGWKKEGWMFFGMTRIFLWDIYTKPFPTL